MLNIPWDVTTTNIQKPTSGINQNPLASILNRYICSIVAGWYVVQIEYELISI